MGNTESSLGFTLGNMVLGALLAPVTGGTSMIVAAGGSLAGMAATCHHASKKTPSSDHPALDFVVGSVSGALLPTGAGVYALGGEVAISAGVSVGGAVIGPTVSLSKEPSNVAARTAPVPERTRSQHDPLAWDRPHQFLRSRLGQDLRDRRDRVKHVSSDLHVALLCPDAAFDNLLVKLSAKQDAIRSDMKRLEDLKTRTCNGFVGMVAGAINVTGVLTRNVQTAMETHGIASVDSLESSLHDSLNSMVTYAKQFYTSSTEQLGQKPCLTVQAIKLERRLNTLRAEAAGLRAKRDYSALAKFASGLLDVVVEQK